MIKKGLSRLAFLFLYLLSLLPFWFLYLIADFLYLIIYHITGYRKAVVRENLSNSFPEKSAAQRIKIEKQYFHYLADLIVEGVKLITISQQQVQRRMHLVNPELIEQYFADGKSIVGAVGHYGNWELGALSLSLLTSNRRIIIYKPLSNPEAEVFFKKIRGRFGSTLVPMKSTLRKMVEYKNELSFSVFVSDQTPVREEAHYFTQFLNQPTAVFLGIEKIAKLTGSVVIFCDIRRVKRGYYQCTFVPLINEPKQAEGHTITEAHVKYLEHVIKAEPPYWLWSHRRWKFKPEGNI
ncbi:lysophospholipid acyltransferase family protein [Mucilaginibacter sp. KACC 22063]|uniref:lysophospholipid acyltransferase family protein n=1 Tax=Mucilaginibacter sp. KACC 22063 TaxID=3025666 RepID=UPI002366A31D|nr:lysophospholipid acyltransferase family protein [Mucilaginibacter sp. KACC 22063]WDF53497.1 lysophospholipid acyltransferase family protein [Mucilaginibacter sp. KACC 22063]